MSPEAQQVGGDAGPVEVHVGGDGRGGRVVGEAPLEPHDLGEGQADASELGGTATFR